MNPTEFEEWVIKQAKLATRLAKKKGYDNVTKRYYMGRASALLDVLKAMGTHEKQKAPES